MRDLLPDQQRKFFALPGPWENAVARRTIWEGKKNGPANWWSQLTFNTHQKREEKTVNNGGKGWCVVRVKKIRNWQGGRRCQIISANTKARHPRQFLVNESRQRHITKDYSQWFRFPASSFIISSVSSNILINNLTTISRFEWIPELPVKK